MLMLLLYVFFLEACSSEYSRPLSRWSQKILELVEDPRGRRLRLVHWRETELSIMGQRRTQLQGASGELRHAKCRGRLAQTTKYYKIKRKELGTFFIFYVTGMTKTVGYLTRTSARDAKYKTQKSIPKLLKVISVNFRHNYKYKTRKLWKKLAERGGDSMEGDASE